jgi:hypothetical protein
MKKQFLLLALYLVAVTGLWAQTATAPSVGDGTEGNPYQIASLDNLYWLSQTDDVWDADIYFIQTADIDASATATWDDGAGFSPIGTSSSNAFKGSYNGKGYTIKGLTINRSTTNYIGLFGCALVPTLDSIGLIDCKVTGEDYVGALVGQLYRDNPRAGYVNACYNSNGTVKGNEKVGGLFGHTYYVNLGTGLTGINNCYTTGTVEGYAYVGGFSGYHRYTPITNCYSACTVYGTGGSYIGGFAATIVDQNGPGPVTNCYSVGKVVGTGNYTAGFSYSNYDVYNCYYNSETSGQSAGGSSYVGIPKTTTEFMQQATFVDWDFTDNWEITEGATYPGLKAVTNGVLIIPIADQLAKLNADYTETVSVMKMGSQDVTLSLVTGPEGMTLTGNEIAWTPTVADVYTVELMVIDGNGYSNTMSYVISVSSLDGTGTENDPFLIQSLEDLQEFSTAPLSWAYYYKQTADINASATRTWNDGAGFSPIGNDVKEFTGNYNGNGYTIDSLYINRPDESYVGLFGLFTGRTIDSLAVTNCSVNGLKYVGALAGIIDGDTVSNTYATGYVAGDTYVGGLVGYNAGAKLKNSYATATVLGSSIVGGLLGQNNNGVYNCFATGYITANSSVGGLIGVNNDTVAVSFYNSETSGQSDNELKGTPKTIVELMQPATFVDWDFDNTWEITQGSSLPRLKGLVDNPVIIPLGNKILKKNVQINEIIQAIGMDDATITIEIVDLPEGMELFGNIIFFTPTELGQYEITIKATDASGKVTTYTYYYQVVTLEGDGSETSPFEIASLADLKELSEWNLFWDKNIIQTADIDASETSSWDTTGFYPIANSFYQFKGNYNGKGYAIDGLSIMRENEDYVGLFSYANSAKIDSLNLKNCNIEGADHTTGLVAVPLNNTIISNSSVSGTVSGDNYVCGIASGERDITSVTITNCYFAGSIMGEENLGGISSYPFEATIEGCYSTGNVTGTDYYVGGIAGYVRNSTISNCYSTSDVSTEGDYAGGLVGYLYEYGGESTLTGSYATGSVYGETYVGGLVGRAYTDTEISDCYSLGSVEGVDDYIGGLIGDLYKGTVSNCYSTGIVSGDGSYVGGLLGRMYSGSTLTNSYYNIEVSGQDDTDQGDPKTTAELMQDATFVDWDFTATWGITTGSTYPALVMLNNAPVAFNDTLDVKGNTDKVVLNDYDYETGQTALVVKMVSESLKGSFYDNSYSFNYGTEVGTKDTIIYRVGEQIAEGDTLWGGTAQAIFTQLENTAPVLTAVANLSTNENTPITITMDELTASDADGDMLYPVISAGANYTTVSPTTIVPDEGYYGSLTVGVEVTDGNMKSDLMNMTITVVAVPDASEITWSAPDTVSYGAAIGAAAMNATTSSVGTITYSFIADSVFDAGSHELIATFTPTVADDYMATADTVNYVVEKVMLTATADNKDMAKGEDVPALTISYSGFVNDETESVLDVIPMASTTATSDSPEGTYTIAVSEGSDNNYDITSVDGTLTIGPNGINQGSLTEISVYPNPANGLVYVTNGANTTVQIYDITGQLMFTEDIVSEIEQINVSDFDAGIYIITIINGEAAVSKRLAIE